MSKRQTKPAQQAITKIEEIQAKNERRVRALVIKADPDTTTETKTLVNPWHTVSGRDGLLPPPLDPLGLAQLAEMSSVLRQCVEAMEINIPGFGYRLKQFKDTIGITGIEAEVAAEREEFEEFLRYADHEERSFTKFRRKTRHDTELVGYSWWEVLRNSKGEVASLQLCPPYSIRMTPRQSFPVAAEQRRLVGRGKSRRIKTVQKQRYFRRFAQARVGESYYGSRQDEISQKTRIVWFKEYGDPRKMSCKTGKYEDEITGEIPPEELATEIIHHSIYSPRTPYGLPRHIGNILAVMGARSAEEINFTTFRNNNIPSMALMVSGGIVTDETIERISEFVEDSIQGSDNYSKFLVIESIPDAEDGDGSAVRMELKPLTREQHTDALFQAYDANAREKIRESYRLPPIFIGRSEDYTRSTAETSRKIADEQIFNPERQEDDHLLNKLLVDMGMRYHYVETNTPNITNDQDIIKVLAAAEKTGGMTPRIAHLMLEDIMGQDLPIPEGVDLDSPFSLQMAEAVKNKAQPNEVGQQVTALKFWQEAMDDPEGAWSEIVNKLQVLKRERDDTPNISINVGSQAIDLASGLQHAALFDIRLNLDGREMLISDGEEAIASVRFGNLQKVGIERAAMESGLEVDDVRSMFPGSVEVWVAPVERREPLREPVTLRQSVGDLFYEVEAGEEPDAEQE